MSYKPCNLTEEQCVAILLAIGPPPMPPPHTEAELRESNAKHQAYATAIIRYYLDKRVYETQVGKLLREMGLITDPLPDPESNPLRTWSEIMVTRCEQEKEYVGVFNSWLERRAAT